LNIYVFIDLLLITVIIYLRRWERARYTIRQPRTNPLVAVADRPEFVGRSHNQEDDMDVVLSFYPDLQPRPEPTIADLIRHREALECEGFVHVTSQDMQLLCGQAFGLPALIEAANAAPDDPDGRGLRRRLYRTASFQPWSGTVRFDDSFAANDGRQYVPYYQAPTVNTDQGGKERRFTPLPDHLESNALLKRLIHVLFLMIPGQMIERRLVVRVGLHLIKLFSDGRRIALPSPNCLHTDGEPWTALVLIDRENVTPNSATNFIASRHCKGSQPQDISPHEVICEITMKAPLETTMVDDSRLSHSVTGCLGANGQPGWRTSLLIDFSPMRPERTS
jgi:hypothetical protein